MSEKRFTSNKRWIAEGTIVDICDNGKVIMQVFDDDNIQNIVDFLNEQEQKIQRWKTLYEIKDREVTARVKRLNEICNRYKYAITFDKDIDPNDAVNILCDRILQTEVEM